jgi:thiol-disulfide isomerase/thioredoxin
MENLLAPEWKITTLNDDIPPELSDFRGKPLLILIFSRGCPGCMGRAIPITQAFRKEYPDLQIVGLHTHFEGMKYSMHQIHEVELFFKLDYPIYVDQEMATYELFKAEGTPHWVLIDEEGKIVRSIFGSMDNARQRLEYALDELFERGR